LTVLALSDRRTTKKVLQSALKDCNLVVDSSIHAEDEDFVDAVRIRLLETRADLIILENMPLGPTTISAAAWLREARVQLPIICVGSLSRSDDAEMAPPGVFILRKPFHKEDLTECALAAAGVGHHAWNAGSFKQ
jgi:hypothetical protein